MRNVAEASEDLLARLFTDGEFRARFKHDPQVVGRELGLDDEAIAKLADTDWVGLDLAARSISRKREPRADRRARWWSLSRFLRRY